MTVLMAAGCLLYGALSLILLFVLALAKGDHATCIVVVLSAGLAYAAQFAGTLSSAQADVGHGPRAASGLSIVGTFSSFAVGFWAFLRLAF